MEINVTNTEMKYNSTDKSEDKLKEEQQMNILSFLRRNFDKKKEKVKDKDSALDNIHYAHSNLTQSKFLRSFPNKEESDIHSLKVSNVSDSSNSSHSDDSVKVSYGNHTGNTSSSFLPNSAYNFDNKRELLDSYPELKKYENCSRSEIIAYKERFLKLMIFIDLLCLGLNFFNVTYLYFDHFNFLHNNYEFSEKVVGNRLLCLGLTVLVCVLLIMRRLCKYRIEILKFYLHITRKPSKKKKFNLSLFIEIIIHLIQPYPYSNFTWKMTILGRKVLFSLDMFLFIFSILRLCYVFKLVHYWYLFSSERSRRIFYFLHGDNHNNDTSLTNKTRKKLKVYSFYLKTGFHYFKFWCLILIFVLVVYFFALVFKVFESYDPKKKNVKFDYIWNCLWFLIVTMTGIGYGDYIPDTMIGRLVTVCSSICGIAIMSLAYVFFYIFIQFDIDEQKSFEEILFLETVKNKSNNPYVNYMNFYIKYKMAKVKKSGSVGITENYKLKIEKSKNLHHVKLKANLNKVTLRDFIRNTTNLIERNNNKIILDYMHYMGRILPKTNNLLQDASLMSRDIKNSQNLSFKLINICTMHTSFPSIFKLHEIDEIQGRYLINKNSVRICFDKFKQGHQDYKKSHRINLKDLLEMSEGYLTQNEFSELSEDSSHSELFKRRPTKMSSVRSLKKQLKNFAKFSKITKKLSANNLRRGARISKRDKPFVTVDPQIPSTGDFLNDLQREGSSKSVLASAGKKQRRNSYSCKEDINYENFGFFEKLDLYQGSVIPQDKKKSPKLVFNDEEESILPITLHNNTNVVQNMIKLKRIMTYDKKILSTIVEEEG